MAPDSSHPVSAGELLARARNELASAGLERPLFEAQLLLADALGIDRARLAMEPSTDVDHRTAATFRHLVARRRNREPMAYIRGVQDFHAVRLSVSPDVLVPRPESELLVEEAMACLRDRAVPLVVDIGTGSGCIAIAIAVALPEARVLAIDISAPALATALGNVRGQGLRSRVVLCRGDCLEAIGSGAADFVVSNPPYIPSGDIAYLQPEVALHEPRIALDGGPDGLTLHRRIAGGARRILRSGGGLAVEVAAGQAPAVCMLFEAAGFVELAVRKDLAGIERVVRATRP